LHVGLVRFLQTAQDRTDKVVQSVGLDGDWEHKVDLSWIQGTATRAVDSDVQRWERDFSTSESTLMKLTKKELQTDLMIMRDAWSTFRLLQPPPVSQDAAAGPGAVTAQAPPCYLAEEMQQGAKAGLFWKKPLEQWSDPNIKSLDKKRLVSMVVSARHIRGMCLIIPPQPQPAQMARQPVAPAVMLDALKHRLLTPLEDIVLDERPAAAPLEEAGADCEMHDGMSTPGTASRGHVRQRGDDASLMYEAEEAAGHKRRRDGGEDGREQAA
jgi:hypothetical protein